MSRDEFLYHPFYCEENVWHLAQSPRFSGRSREVIFISNPARSVTMWHQRGARGGSISWDYHVIVRTRDPQEVWDLDTDLSLPVRAKVYFEKSFRAGVPGPFEPWFRVVEAETFVAQFASDRSHMLGRDGRFERSPPPWAPIGDGPSNLMRFVDVTQPFVGAVRRRRKLSASA